MVVSCFAIRMAIIVNCVLPNFGIAKRGNITHIMFWSNVGWGVCSAAALLRAMCFCEFRHFFHETIVIIMVWLCCFAQESPKPPQRHRNEPSDHALPMPNWARDRLGWQCQISPYLGSTHFSNLNVIENVSRNKKLRFRGRAAGPAWASSACMVEWCGLAISPRLGWRIEFPPHKHRPASFKIWIFLKRHPFVIEM